MVATIKCFIGLVIILLYHIIFIFGDNTNNTAPPDPFQCYNCNTTDLNCTQNLDTVKLIDCATKNCFTKTDEKGYNIRGCLEANELCDNGCKNCNETKCNNKKHPEDRIECQICNGETCKQPLNKTILPCEVYKKQDQCYTYFDSEKIVRDCVSKKDELCKNNPDYCIECTNKTANEICNNNTVKDLQCFKCDDCKGSRSDDKCDLDKEEHVPCKIDKSMNLCYTQRKSNNVVTRGCAKDVENIIGLEFCKGNNCNKECIPDIQCPICQEHNDPTCSENKNETSWYKQKCETSTTVCHSCLNLDDTTVRGCGKPLANQTNCNYCYTDKCTAPVPQIKRTCYKCGKNNPKCSRLPKASGIAPQNCEVNLTQCFTKLNDDNLIERGCTTSDDKCPENSADKCKICNENNCNIDIIPANRRLCYQCDSKTTPNCTEPNVKDSILEGNPCQVYKKNDTCYTTYNDTDTMIRGCTSDPLSDPNRNKCDKNPESCIHCDNDKCNDLPFKRSKLLCVQCNQNDTNCVWGQNGITAKNCEKLEFWKNETCFTYTDSITKVIRGCTHDKNNLNLNCTDNNNKKCKICNTDGCNIENRGNQTCYRCRSDAPGEIECSYNKLKKIKPSNCRNAVTNSTNIGCFTEKYYNGVVFRGCLVDLDPEIQAKCRNTDYKDCVYCEGNDCNDGKVPGGNSLVHYISFMVLILSFILYLIM